MKHILLLAVTPVFSAPAHAQNDLETGFAGALLGCEEWVLNPASWAEGTAPFAATVGLGDKMGLVNQIDEAALPPKEMRAGNHFWRINSTQTAGYILVVSDKLPMCHITGGGNSDLQPAVEFVIASSNFASHWEPIADLSKGDMKSTQFRSREAPSFTMVISRANSPNQRLDRIQVLATATYKLKE